MGSIFLSISLLELNGGTLIVNRGPTTYPIKQLVILKVYHTEFSKYPAWPLRPVDHMLLSVHCCKEFNNNVFV